MKKLAVETDLAGLVNKMYEQLVALERKVDTLISRSSDQGQDVSRYQKSGPRFRHQDRSGGAKYDDRSREKNFTQAVCSKCGKECKLPFRPTGDRPVYCRDCFSAEGNFTRGRKFGDKKKGSFSKKRKKRF